MDVHAGIAAARVAIGLSTAAARQLAESAGESFQQVLAGTAAAEEAGQAVGRQPAEPLQQLSQSREALVAAVRGVLASIGSGGETLELEIDRTGQLQANSTGGRSEALRAQLLADPPTRQAIDAVAEAWRRVAPSGASPRLRVVIEP